MPQHDIRAHGKSEPPRDEGHLPDLFGATIERIRNIQTNRVDLSDLEFRGKGSHWARAVAERIVAEFPQHSVYTCAAGISPSGVVHFGNFRDVMTSLLVIKQLQELGKETSFIFSWDDFDRFRKVPNGVDPSFSKYLGLPLCNVPDPLGKLESYARRFEVPFEETMRELGIRLEYRYQGQEYQSGRYNPAIIEALLKREEIADILLAHMSHKGMENKGIDPIKYRETFYPISVYSRFSGKDDTTVLGFDGKSEILYRCHDTGKIDKVDLNDLSDSRVKLAWKIDWPMRWREEGVVFEPGGHDHASPNGSYDVSGRVCRQIFNYSGPLFVGYSFIGLQGLDGKMSGSKGGAMTPGDLVKIYEPELLKWLYARKRPDQEFNLAFDTEVFRLYNEFDRCVAQAKAGKLSEYEMTAITTATSDSGFVEGTPINFRQAAGLGQSVDWRVDKALEAERALGNDFDVASVESRFKRARYWLEEFNRESMMRVRETQNAEYLATMSDEAKVKVRQLQDALSQGMSDLTEINSLVYAIPKVSTASEEENKVLQRSFFKDVYQLLIGGDTGPRLSTLLWAMDRKLALQLLSI